MDDSCFAGRVAELEIRNEALQFSELATLDRMSKGGSPGPESSLAKNTSVDIDQTLNTLKLEAIHYYGLPNANKISLNGHSQQWLADAYSETVTSRYINSRAASIFGGSAEVQKNIIAKVVLGL
jgi:alkylation response protein AidB-like acyl-CoA dehydrogenase